jgi:uncharacterized protein YecA (UPF0149 family)
MPTSTEFEIDPNPPRFEDVAPEAFAGLVEFCEAPAHFRRMNRLHAAAPVVLEPRDKTGRNDPCPCNSGKKFKKCCGANL